jgi:two-component system, chemotaxis family, protein-glutamate methylesterase/glutaminase
VIHRLVVVGASFGGFDALKTVLHALPASFPVPLAIVQHVGSPGAGLAPLLQRYSTLVVADAEDKDDLFPGFAYLAPPGYHLLVERGSLTLSIDPPVQHARPSIDVLFESAADAYGPEVVGVILTGTGRDGAAGLAHIKRRGGLAIVQDPITARRAAMPEAALASTPVDLVLPVEKIGGWLVQHFEQHGPRDNQAPQRETHEPLAPESSLTRI